MPSLPRSLAPGFERLTARIIATITATERPSPGFVLITARPTSCGREGWPTPGTHFGVRVSVRDFRHYTIYGHNDDGLQILIDLAASGPGVRWARQVQPGDRLPILVPGGGMALLDRVNPLLVGDATAVATIRALGGDATNATCALEVHPADVDFVSAAMPGATVLAATGGPGVAMDDWLSRAVDNSILSAHLAGHAQSIQRQRSLIREQSQLGRRRIATQAHWSDTRTGL